MPRDFYYEEPLRVINFESRTFPVCPNPINGVCSLARTLSKYLGKIKASGNLRRPQHPVPQAIEPAQLHQSTDTVYVINEQTKESFQLKIAAGPDNIFHSILSLDDVSGNNQKTMKDLQRLLSESISGCNQPEDFIPGEIEKGITIYNSKLKFKKVPWQQAYNSSIVIYIT